MLIIRPMGSAGCTRRFKCTTHPLDGTIQMYHSCFGRDDSNVPLILWTGRFKCTTHPLDGTIQMYHSSFGRDVNEYLSFWGILQSLPVKDNLQQLCWKWLLAICCKEISGSHPFYSGL